MKEKEKIRFNFPEGILGFENIREFVIFESGYEPFLIMESNNKDVSFLLTSPLFFFKEYDPKIQEPDWEDIKIKGDNEKAILCIVNMHVKDYKEVTANLKAPIILNKKEFIGKQVIVTNEDYPLSYKVFQRDK